MKFVPCDNINFDTRIVLPNLFTVIEMYMTYSFLILAVNSIFAFIFTSYLRFFLFFDIYRHWFYTNVENLEEYDYIVVGAGSAGATLSARLADNNYKVLLLEAGGLAPPFLDIPLVAPLIQRSYHDWQYVTVPQQHACKSLTNNQSRWPMGKILGGSSRLNYMLYVRGHPSDYEQWFPDFVEPTLDNGGPMNITDSPWSSDVADVILEGLKELDQHIGNINKDSKTGFMKAQLSMENGKRWSADKLLYQNLNNRPSIITHAFVERILIESSKATGVQFTTLNKTFRAKARKGVILSAGAIGSPKILMLSGIGPRKSLEELNINVIKDLPVGKNLVDHIITGLDLVTLNVSTSLSMTDILNPASALHYFIYGKGPWTSTAVEVVGTFHSSLQKNKSEPPALQLMTFPLGISRDNGVILKEMMGISEKTYEEYFAPLLYDNAITIGPVLLHPKSTGEVRLRSNDPFDAPLIDPKYLSNKDDVTVLIEGLNFVMKLVETNAMKSLGASIYKKSFPGCENKLFGSVDYWECYIRHLTLTSYHPAGTCRMGDVVDASYRVYGIENLYVVDASVFPSLPSGNINAAVIMLAEKAARIFKEHKNNYINSGKCYAKLLNEYYDIYRA